MIPANRPSLNKNDSKKLFKVGIDNWISSSEKEIKIYKTQFTKLMNKKYRSLATNRIESLEIALKSLNLKKNEEAIFPNFTIISNTLATLKNDLKNKLIDCDQNKIRFKKL